VPKYQRVFGLDVGTKRVGLARSDLLQLSANSVGTFPRQEIIERLKKEADTEEIALWVVGWPLRPDGTEDKMTKIVQDFINELQRHFPDIPIEKMDERYSSREAVQHMIDAGVPRMKRREKERIDRMSAAVILQNYLDMNRNK